MHKKERGVNPSDFRMHSLLIIEQNKKSFVQERGGARAEEAASNQSASHGQPAL